MGYPGCAKQVLQQFVRRSLAYSHGDKIYPNSSSLIWRLQHKRCEAVINMAQSRLLVMAALLGLQAGARADDTPAPTAVISTITLSPTEYTPPNNEDDRDWTDDVGRRVSPYGRDG